MASVASTLLVAALIGCAGIAGAAAWHKARSIRAHVPGSMVEAYRPLRQATHGNWILTCNLPFQNCRFAAELLCPGGATELGAPRKLKGLFGRTAPARGSMSVRCDVDRRGLDR
ncbi:hypothetical protein [Mesobaculum littorinae]|nr:hypothetical protein [Mesobaculum littorinae]